MRTARACVIAVVLILAFVARAAGLSLQDSAHRLQIGPATVPGFGGPEVVVASGRFYGSTGVYVDNETPDRCAWARTLHAEGYNPVLLGVGPGADSGCPRVNGVWQLKEWYPFGRVGGCSYRWTAPSPWHNRKHHWRWHGYIIQRNFAWTGCSPPNLSQRRSLLRQARRRDPLILLTY